MSAAPARILHLEGGALEEGGAADIMIADLDKKYAGMGSSAVYIPRYAGTVDGSGVEKKTEGLEVCENSLHDSQYYSDSSDRRYVYTSVKPQLWYPQIYVRRVRP